jgi:hypothetical protein
VLIDRPRVIQDPRHSERRLSQTGARLGRLVHHASPTEPPDGENTVMASICGSPGQTDGKAVSISGTKAAMHQRGTKRPGRASKHVVKDEERQALRPEELDPDDPAVITAIDLVRWELSLGT